MLILGAGIAGLGAATALQAAGRDFLVLEQSEGVGGLARTDEIDGFMFDQTGHYLHFRDRETKRFFLGLGVPLIEHRRRAAVMLAGRPVPYPLQYNLWALDEGTRKTALESLRRAQKIPCRRHRSFEAALRSNWGDALADMFFVPYHEKLWARPLNQLPADCTGRYGVRVNLNLAERGSQATLTYAGYNGVFYHPESGRTGDLTESMARPFRRRVVFGAYPINIDARSRCCLLADGRRFEYDALISTAPLPQLLDLLGERIGSSDLLQFSAVANIRIGFRGRMRVPYHWVYLPDKSVRIYRLGLPWNVNQRTAPSGHASLSLEYGLAAPADPRPSPEEVADATLALLRRAGWIDVEEVVLLDEKIISPAYVVYRSQGRPACKALRERLRSIGIHLAGRFGCWDYYSMEDALQSGVEAAREVEPNAQLPTL